MISRAKLAIMLSKLGVFDNPKNKLEQYPTDSETASILLYNAFTDGAISGKVVVDFGCGSGILGIGALLLGAKKCVFVDVDPDVEDLLRKNAVSIINPSFKTEDIEFEAKEITKFEGSSDTVIMNPPFGTRMKHADKAFLLKAFETADSVYSIHKSTSEGFLKAICADNEMDMGILDYRSYPLKASYGFHKSPIKRIDTILIRCTRKL
ncbi:MAG: METTL5 family protein [Candidatus Cloacimonetes bacterium]|nr:METTL5 family protein [Candidatus Cloacimonadota bacterium]